jgi:hypothetical protein
VLQARFNLITADPDRKWLAETAGFCGALLLVDWNSGHSISETIWDSPRVAIHFTGRPSRRVTARAMASSA